MQTIYIVSASVLAVLSLAAIYTHSFPDNLVQRIGLSLTCFGSIFRLLELSRGEDSSVTPPGLLIVTGVAIFACGTAYKLLRAHYHRRGLPERRINHSGTP